MLEFPLKDSPKFVFSLSSVQSGKVTFIHSFWCSLFRKLKLVPGTFCKGWGLSNWANTRTLLTTDLLQNHHQHNKAWLFKEPNLLPKRTKRFHFCCPILYACCTLTIIEMNEIKTFPRLQKKLNDAASVAKIMSWQFHTALPQQPAEIHCRHWCNRENEWEWRQDEPHSVGEATE